MTNKESLIQDYIKLTDKQPSAMHIRMVELVQDSDTPYEWVKAANNSSDYMLQQCDPFALPDFNDTNFGLDAKPSVESYHKDPFDLPDNPAGEHKRTIKSKSLSVDPMKQVLSTEDRDKLLTNHESLNPRTAKQVLDGFSIERLIECYAEGINDDIVCKYLKIRPGQLKSWIAMSQQRISIIKRLQDIMRSQKIEQIVGESLDYEIGEIFDKADAAYESLRLDAMKMRSKVALDLDSKSRYKDESDGGSLPVVNLGLQVNISKEGKSSLDSVKPVIPGVLGS